MNVSRPYERATGRIQGLRQGQGQNLARVQPVSQVMLSLPTTDPEATFAAARKEVLVWLARRAGRLLPDEACEGRGFELTEVGAQRTAAANIDEPPYWAARVDDADKDIAQRVWTVEVGIGISGPLAVLFGCRLQCASRGANPPFSPTIPGVVRQLITRLTCELSGRRISDNAWKVTDEAGVDDLVRFLESPARRHPVILVSCKEDDNSPAIDVEAFQRRVAGAAHVVELRHEASFRLTDHLGKEFSVFNGAVRTYHPRFDPETNQPRAHPIAFSQAIEHWPEDGPDGFCRFLTSQILRNSIATRRLEEELPSFADIQGLQRRKVRERAVREGRPEAEQIEIAQEEIANLKRQIEEKTEEANSLIEMAAVERDQAREERDEAKEELAGLRARVAYLHHALSCQGQKERPDIPESLEQLEEWSRVHLAGGVKILNRAYRAAKKSGFENVELVYQTLIILRDCYVPLRNEGGLEQKQEYEQRLQELGLEETASFTGPRAGEQGDEYFVEYRGRRRELDRHLKGSNSRDPRYGFRVYFFWDDEDSQVVIGWLPSHLSSRAT